MFPFWRGGNFTVFSSLINSFLSGLLEETTGVIYATKSFKILLDSSSSKISGLGSLIMLLPALTSELFFGFSRSFERELVILEGGFLSQLSSILNSPFEKKVILLIYYTKC